MNFVGFICTNATYLILLSGFYIKCTQFALYILISLVF